MAVGRFAVKELTMVVRVTSAASIMALAVAAWPFPAQAQSPTPKISCTTPGAATLAAVIPSTVNAINWGDGFGFGAPNILVDALPAVQFNCNGGMYSADVTGNKFSVNFGPIGVPGDPSYKVFPGQFTYDLVGTQEYKEQKPDGQLTVTEFDLAVSVHKWNFDGFLALDHKDYIVIKMDSAFGDALSDTNKLFFNQADGSVSLDPPIPGGPGGSGTIELSTTPTAAPEPATFALLGTGLLAAARVLRRKSRR
jgi:hypothetical protein